MSKIANKLQIHFQILNLQQNKSEMKNFKEKINIAISRLENAKKYINKAETEIEVVYTGKAIKSRKRNLEDEVQEITNIKQELKNILEELNQKIISLNYDIDEMNRELKKL